MINLVWIVKAYYTVKIIFSQLCTKAKIIEGLLVNVMFNSATWHVIICEIYKQCLSENSFLLQCRVTPRSRFFSFRCQIPLDVPNITKEKVPGKVPVSDLSLAFCWFSVRTCSEECDRMNGGCKSVSVLYLFDFTCGMKTKDCVLFYSHTNLMIRSCFSVQNTKP